MGPGRHRPGPRGGCGRRDLRVRAPCSGPGRTPLTPRHPGRTIRCTCSRSRGSTGPRRRGRGLRHPPGRGGDRRRGSAAGPAPTGSRRLPRSVRGTSSTTWSAASTGDGHLLRPVRDCVRALHRHLEVTAPLGVSIAGLLQRSKRWCWDSVALPYFQESGTDDHLGWRRPGPPSPSRSGSRRRGRPGRNGIGGHPATDAYQGGPR